MSAGGAGGAGRTRESDARPVGQPDDPFAGATIRVHDPSRNGGGNGAGASHGASVGVPAAGAPGAGTAAGDGGLTPWWRQLRFVVGGGLMLACFALFGWQIVQGRPASPVTIGGLGGGQRVEIRVHVDGAVAQPGVYRLAQGDRVEDAVRAAGGLAPNADGSRLNLAQRVRDEQRLDVPFLPAAAQAASQPALAAVAAGAGGAAQGAPAGDAAAGGPAEGAQAAPAEGVPGAGPAAGVPAPGGAAGPQPAAQPASTPRPTATARPAATPRPTEFSGGKVNVNTANQAQLEQLPGFGEVSAKRIIDYRAANGPLRSTDDLRRAGITQALINRAAPYIVFQ